MFSSQNQYILGFGFVNSFSFDKLTFSGKKKKLTHLPFLILARRTDVIWGAKEAPSERVLTSMGHEFESFIRLLQCQATVWKEPKL